MPVQEEILEKIAQLSTKLSRVEEDMKELIGIVRGDADGSGVLLRSRLVENQIATLEKRVDGIDSSEVKMKMAIVGAILTALTGAIVNLWRK